MLIDITGSMCIPETENNAWIDGLAEEIEACRGHIVAKADVSLEFRSPFLNYGKLRGVTFGRLLLEHREGMSIVHYHLSMAPTRLFLFLCLVAGTLWAIWHGAGEGVMRDLCLVTFFAVIVYLLTRFVALLRFRQVMQRAAQRSLGKKRDSGDTNRY